jgi:hypothetical protein
MEWIGQVELATAAERQPKDALVDTGIYISGVRIGYVPVDAGLQVEVQHFAEKMLHGQNVSAVEFGGAYRAPGAEG